MLFQEGRVHLSSRGSHFNFLRDGGLYLSNIAEKGNSPRLFQIHIPLQEAVAVNAECVFAGEDLRCAFYGNTTVIFRGHRAVRLQYNEDAPYKAHTAVWEDGMIRISDTRTGCFYWLAAVKGRMELHARWQEGIIGSQDVSVELLPGDDGFEVVLYGTEKLEKVELACPSFEQAAEKKSGISRLLPLPLVWRAGRSWRFLSGATLWAPGKTTAGRPLFAPRP